MTILILGAGRMARGLVYDFLQNNNLKKISIIDQSPEALKQIAERFHDSRIQTSSAAADDLITLRPMFREADGALSAVPYDYNPALTELAIECGTHFVDLGGNNTVVKKQFALNEKARAAGIGIVPDCGLAPGMASIIAARAVNELARVDSLKIRVGGLPLNPEGALNYQLVFSVHGLINEYIEPAVILEDGQIQTVPSMTDVEEIEFPKPFGLLEAFYTSGGTSTLPQTYRNRINHLDYKTIRYPGHCHNMKVMLDLGFAQEEEIEVNGALFNKRDVFEKMLSIPLHGDDEDVVLVRVTVHGQKGGDRKTIQYQAIEYGDDKAALTAMMRMTAFPAAIILQMLVSGQITDHGVLRQEVSIPPQLFMNELEKRNIVFKEIY